MCNIIRQGVIGLSLLAPPTLHGQVTVLAPGGTRTIRGTVVDSGNHKPISQATISLGRTDTGERTAGNGTFRVSAAEGALILMVRRPGYIPALIPVPPGASGADTDIDTTTLRQVKNDADRAAVQAADISAYPELARFYEHKTRYPQGLFLTPDDLQRAGGTLVSIIRQQANFRFVCYVNQKREWDCGEQANRGPNSIMRPNVTSPEREPCPLTVWANGAEPFRESLDIILLDRVLAAEAYPHPGVTPGKYAGSPCATLILYMREAEMTEPAR